MARIEEYQLDLPLREFFWTRVKPLIVAQMVKEGRWYPYKKQPPAEAL